ncbi:UDP-glycosyltransferase 83A1-like [Olea europaea subsp. europaea]|uniref:UDP-glycosyltransferase 83A1-like n=1 Tax=Olea europaea subsp. europaea TaxID=158383 RepID=A0A8S0R3A4_OLEEU|nr:UDP-glycosyltransferase 83A1-like [Olea europaea subsp. europaea]
MVTPHVLAIPYPAQGHVIPLMEVSLRLVEHGIKVTFVNTEFDHKRVVEALSETENTQEKESVNLVSIPDGMEPWEDRNELGKLSEGILNVMPGKLEDLIQKINETDRDKITCVIADCIMGWALELAKKLGIKTVAFFPAAAAVFNLLANCPKLIDDGIIDSDGRVLKKQMFQLSPAMPVMNSETLAWISMGDLATQKIMFHFLVNNCISANVADWSICNSTSELEPTALALIPNCKPIGPLLANYRLGKSSGHFWPQEETCLEWLDQQPSQSVIYVAFGSFTIFNETQFQELALGLELTNRPFLWVVRHDVSTVKSTLPTIPEGFNNRVQNRGLIVSWAPQQKVLSHPSVTCFLSHCGWNSTVEGVSNGVPFLCWPYFADQFFNQTYICDHWEVGLELDKDARGIIRKEEIKNKLEQLLTDKSYKERAFNLQIKTVASATKGCSHKNFNNFVEWIKEKDNHSL